jgi:hypothetical protein
MKRSLNHRVRDYLLRQANDRRVLRLSKSVQRSKPNDMGKKPVVFFNASTRLGGISLNAGFATLAAMRLQLEGIPVHFFGCRSGLHRCTLGVMMNGAENEPPCKTCIAQAEVMYSSASTHWFEYEEDPELAVELQDRSVASMERFQFRNIPLGKLTLPSMRWSLRIHHLQDEEATRALYRSFIQSAYGVINDFDRLLVDTDPQCVIVFNGISYPEASARWAARQRGIRVVTHEVAHQPITAFFADGQVTAYPVDIPDDFELDEAQNTRLDEYLADRFKGNFTMAGFQFWPEMKDLDEDLLEKINSFKQLVPIFTNVIFDTSQVHANVLFEHMFAWLDQFLEIIRAHPETLFVIRAHPDELRLNSRKQAEEKVDDWVAENKVAELENVIYIPPLEFISSYALIRRAKFVVAYNSTIGLEAALMGKPVLNGGKARYTQYPCVFLPESAADHRQKADELLNAETLEIPAAFIRNARRFQYYQLWRTPLPFDEFMEPHDTRGYVHVKPVTAEDVKNSKTLKVIRDGIIDGADFLYPEK